MLASALSSRAREETLREPDFRERAKASPAGGQVRLTYALDVLS